MLFQVNHGLGYCVGIVPFCPPLIALSFSRPELLLDIDQQVDLISGVAPPWNSGNVDAISCQCSAQCLL